MSEMKKKIADLMAQHSLKRASECAPKDATQEHGMESRADGEVSPVKRGAAPPDGDASPINGDAAQAAGEVSPGESLDDELRRRRRTLLDLSHRLNLRSGAEWAQEKEALAARLEAGDFEIDRVIPGELVGDEESRFFLVRRDYPLDHQQGDLRLGDALQCLSAHVAFSACDPALADFNPQTALFMDTETIGLAGGAGTVAFLVGVGYFQGGTFRLEQAFMRDFDEEEPMLRYLDGLFRGRSAVVTYNGKCFDVPLLRTRFIQNRLPFRLDAALQYDLLHAARRFWKRRLGDCGLANIEREVLAVRRHGDVPSAEIPELWLDYLRTRDARPLEAVFYHHKTDILSLAGLMGRLSNDLSAPQGKGFAHAEERISLLRLYFMQKNYPEVLEYGQRLLEDETHATLRCECLYYMGMACKRLEQWLAMEEAWTLLLAEDPRNLIARAELAKYYEHRARNLLEAERICAETIALLETRSAFSPSERPAGINDFQHRLIRIRRKLGRKTGDMDLPE